MAPSIPDRDHTAQPDPGPLSPERLAEIKALLRHESSFSFCGDWVRESLLLVVVEYGRLAAELAKYVGMGYYLRSGGLECPICPGPGYVDDYQDRTLGDWADIAAEHQRTVHTSARIAQRHDLEDPAAEDAFAHLAIDHPDAVAASCRPEVAQ